MAQFILDTGDGRKATVDAPAGSTREQVIDRYNQALQRQLDAPRIADENRLQQGREARRRAGDAQMAAYKPTIMDYIAEVPKGLVGGAAGIIESGALGIAALLPEEAENVVRDGIKYVGGAAQEYVEPTQNTGDSVPRKFSEALGSFVGLAGVFAANPYAGVATAVGAGAGEASERARAADATQDERNLAALLGVLPGALELVPINRFVKGVKALKTGTVSQSKLITNRIKRAGLEGGIEGAQETASSIAQNMIEQGYNPEKGTFDGSGEAAGYGFSVGAFAQTMLDLATPRSRVGANTSDQSDVDSEEERSTTIRTTEAPSLADARIAISESLDKTGEVDFNTLRTLDAPALDIEKIINEEKAKRNIVDEDYSELGELLTGPRGVQDKTRFDEAVAKGKYQGNLRENYERHRAANPLTAMSFEEYVESGMGTSSLEDMELADRTSAGIKSKLDRVATDRATELLSDLGTQQQTSARIDRQLKAIDPERDGRLDRAVATAGSDVARGLASLRPEAQMDLATDPRRTEEERAQLELFPEQVREDALGRETLRESIPATAARAPTGPDLREAAPTTDAADQLDPYRSDLLSFLPDGLEGARRRKADQQETDLAERSDAQTALKQLSAQETADAKQVTDRLAETDATRTKVLQDTIANAGELRRPEVLRKTYEDALTAAGVTNAKATSQEVISLKRASDAIRAKSPAPDVDNIIVPPALEAVTDPRQTDMEAQVAPKPVTPTQDSFAGMGRSAKLGTPPMRPGQDTFATTEPTVEPRIIDEKFLDNLQIRPQAAVRKRTMGKDFNDPVVRADIASYAGLKSTQLEAKNQINRLLDETDLKQDSIFDKKEPPNKRAKSNAKPDADKTKPPNARASGDGDAGAGSKRKSNREARAAAGASRVRTPNGSGVGSSSGSSSKPSSGASKSDTTLDEANAKLDKAKQDKNKREAAAASNAVKKRKEEVKKEVKNVDPNRNKATAKRLVSAAKDTSASDADTTKRNAIGGGTTDPDAPKLNLPPKPKAPVTTPVRQRKDRPTSADYLVERHSERTQPFQDELQENSDLRYSKNPFSEADNAQILALLDRKLKDVETKGDLNLLGVRAYLSRFPNPADGIRLAVEDVATQNPMAKVDGVGETLAELGLHLSGVGRNKTQIDIKGKFPSKQPSQAERLIAWVRANLSAEANNELTKMQTKAQNAVIRSILVDPANVEIIAQFNKLRAASDRRQKGIDAVLVDVIKPQDLVDDGIITAKEADELFYWKDDRYYLALSSDAVVGLDVPAHSSVVNALKNGNLRDALLFVSQTSPNKQTRQLARKFADVTGNTKVVIKKDLKLDGRPVAGLFEPRTNTITLDADAGINLHTLMHEMSHAAGSAAIADKSSQLAIKLNELFKRVKGNKHEGRTCYCVTAILQHNAEFLT